MLVELRIVLIALLQEHIPLLPIRVWLLAREIVLINQRFDRFIGAFSDGILQAANQLIFWNLTAELCEAADQIVKFVQVDGDIGTVLMLQRLELLQCCINITVGEAAVAI